MHSERNFFLTSTEKAMSLTRQGKEHEPMEGPFSIKNPVHLKITNAFEVRLMDQGLLRMYVDLYRYPAAQKIHGQCTKATMHNLDECAELAKTTFFCFSSLTQ